MAAKNLFELFDCDGSETLSPIEFCAGIALLREKAKDENQRKLTDDFMAAAGKKGGLWDIMSADAGWGTGIPVMQLPALTPVLWQKFLDSTDSDEALEAYVKSFYGDAASWHQELRSARLKGIAERMLKATQRGGGGGDFFDLNDADFSGTLTPKEMFATIYAMKKAVPAKSAICSYWETEVKGLYQQMAADAGWPRDTKITMLPALTRPQFEKFWNEKSLTLETFGQLVTECCEMRAKVQAIARSDAAQAAADAACSA